MSKKCFGLDSTGHEMDHGDINHRLTTYREVFLHTGVAKAPLCNFI